MSRKAASTVFNHFKTRIAKSDQPEKKTNQQWELQVSIFEAVEVSGVQIMELNASDPNPVKVAVFADDDVAFMLADCGRTPKDSQKFQGKEFRHFINEHQASKAVTGFFQTVSDSKMTLLLFVSGEIRCRKGAGSHTALLSIWRDHGGDYCFREFDPNPGTDSRIMPMAQKIISKVSRVASFVPIVDGDNGGGGECFKLSVNLLFSILKGKEGPRGGDVARIFNMQTDKYL